MTRQADAAAYFAATFAARLDDHVVYNGTMWVRAGHPLTPQAVLDGLAGAGPSISGYFLTPESAGHVAAIDFDSDDGLDLARRCRAALLRRDAPAWVEASRRGAHLWVVVDAVRPGSVLRKFLRAVLADAGIPATCVGRRLVDGACVACGRKMLNFAEHDDPKIEYRPNSDTIRPDGYGAPLRLPTMPNPKTGLRYPMLDAQDRPLPRALDDMMLAMAESEFCPAWVVDSLAAQMRPTPRSIRPGDRLPGHRPDDDGMTASEILRTLWGMPEPKVGRANTCPAHDDRNPSLSIAHDDTRVWCKTGGCILSNDGRGRGTHELVALAPGRTL